MMASKAKTIIGPLDKGDEESEVAGMNDYDLP